MQGSEPTTLSDLAVIIVSYNTCALLRNCLRALESSSPHRPAIWVVDNASQDGSAEMVRAEFPDVHLVEPGHNLGFAAANNRALRQMGFGGETPGAHLPEYVLFLNPDTEVQADAVARMRAFLRDTPRAGVVGPALIYPDGSFQHSAFRFPTLWQVWFDLVQWPGRFVESSLNGRYPRALYAAGQPFRIDHPLGAAFMTRAQVIQQVGLMDEGFFMYAEEVDWCMRVKRAGWEIYCLPTAVVVHHGGGSTRQQPAHMNQVLWRSRFRLFEKHYGKPFTWAAHLLLHLAAHGHTAPNGQGH
ncbi:MAG: glycosyltransferase family 2 protein [Ardenticatenia bacterium]|jgi:GT2 family glycosyltransferase|nr:MAG: glycosyltransferase family 2 protein [Ardenticatenia bacterium]